MQDITKDQKIAQFFDSVSGFYANNYKNNTHISYFFNQRLEIVFGFLESCDRPTILDIGCGPGMMAEYAIQKKFPFFGVDISEKMIDRCIKKFGQTDLTQFSVGKVQSLPFPDAFFDVVLCMGILEYLDEAEIDGAVSELSRVLKPNGMLITSLIYKKSFLVWNRRVVKMLKQKITGRKYDLENHDTLSRSFDENSFLNVLKSNRLTDDIEVDFFCVNIIPCFLENRLSNQVRITLSRALNFLIRGQIKWPYMAFITKVKKQSNEPI